MTQHARVQKKLCLPKMLPTKLDARVSALLRGSRGALCCAGVRLHDHNSPKPPSGARAGRWRSGRLRRCRFLAIARAKEEARTHLPRGDSVEHERVGRKGARLSAARETPPVTTMPPPPPSLPPPLPPPQSPPPLTPTLPCPAASSPYPYPSSTRLACRALLLHACSVAAGLVPRLWPAAPGAAP